VSLGYLFHLFDFLSFFLISSFQSQDDGRHDLENDDIGTCASAPFLSLPSLFKFSKISFSYL